MMTDTNTLIKKVREGTDASTVIDGAIQEAISLKKAADNVEKELKKQGLSKSNGLSSKDLYEVTGELRASELGPWDLDYEIGGELKKRGWKLGR